MEILVKKRPKIYVRKPLPDFKSDLERQKYRIKEKQKWLEGAHGLTGMYYHFLQEQTIKDRVSGQTLIPEALERDLMVYEEVESARKSFTPVLILKARGTALSTFFGAATNYHMRAYPGSTCLVTSADQPRIAKLYYDKIKVCHEGYHPDIRYDLIKSNETMAKIYMQLAVKHLDDNGTEKLSISDLYCNQTNNTDESASSFSGTGAIFGAYDEIALNKRRNKLLQSSESCYIDPNTSERKGLLVMGGTAEDTLTTDELAQFKLLYDKSVQMGYKIIFLPYWYRFHDKNGYIDKEAGERWYEKQYNIKIKSDDPADLQAFLKNNPSKLEDIFSLGGTSFFNSIAVDNLKAVREKIILEPTPQKYDIAIIDNVARPNKNGKWTIKEPPKENIKYDLVIDGVATGTLYGASENAGSKVAATMVKGYDPATNLPFETVAIFEWRPDSLEQTFPYLLAGARFYNKFGGFRWMLPEASNSTHELMPQYMIKEGCIHWLKNTVDYSKLGNIKTNRYGQFINQHSLEYSKGRWNTLLEKYPHGISMVKAIDDMLKPTTENADIRSSLILYPFLLDKDFDKPPEKPKAEYKKIPRLVYNGRTSKIVWEKILVKKIEDIKEN